MTDGISIVRKRIGMKKILVTGGTVFVSRYIAEYYVVKGCMCMFSTETTENNRKEGT